MQAVPHRGQGETVQEKSGNGKRFTHFITSVLTNVFLALKEKHFGGNKHSNHLFQQTYHSLSAL